MYFPILIKTLGNIQKHLTDTKLYIYLVYLKKPQLEMMLKEIGLESNRVGTIEHQSRIAPANMVAMFEQGQIDAAAAPEPWGTYLVEELNANVVTEWNNVF